MEEQAKQALAQLLDRAVQGVDAAVEFSQAQVPDVVEQLLVWHMVQSSVVSAIGAALVVASLYVAYWTLSRKPQPLPEGETGRYSWSEYKGTVFHDHRGEITGIQVFSLLLVLPLAAGVMMFNLDWLQILIAPKLYLLEYAAQLVK